MDRKKIIITITAMLALILVSTLFFARSPNDVESQLEAANKHLAEGDYEKVILAFESVIKFDENNIEARMGLAKTYVLTNEIEKAQNYLEEVIEIDEAYAEAYIELGSLSIEEGRVDEAIKVFEKGLQNTGNEKIKALLENIMMANEEIIIEESEAVPLAIVEEIVEEALEVYVGVKVLNVRDNPSKSSNKIGTVQTNQSFIVQDERLDEEGVIWYLVEYADGQPGWIISQYCYTEEDVIHKLKLEKWSWKDDGGTWINEFKDSEVWLYLYGSDWSSTYYYDNYIVTKVNGDFKVTFNVYRTEHASYEDTEIKNEEDTYTIIYFGDYIKVETADGSYLTFGKE